MKNMFSWALALFSLTMLDPTAATAQADTEQTRFYLARLSSMVVGRPLNSSELETISKSGRDAIDPIVSAWLTTDSFHESTRDFVDGFLLTSGVKEDIDYNTPGYLARHLSKSGQPFSRIITSDNCVNASGAQVACDSGAPRGAGVLTTRAFLAKTAGPYNISRAGKLLNYFTCSSYALEANVEPRLAIADLIDMFASTNGPTSFGNGSNCYFCHSQFGLHAQLFIKYDKLGRYQPNATGMQDPSPNALPGYAPNNTYSSHLKDPARAASEKTRYFGRDVSSLREAAEVIVRAPSFYPCVVQRVMAHYLRMNPDQMKTVHVDVARSIARSVLARDAEPTLAAILKGIVTNPTVVSSMRTPGGAP